MPGYKTFKYWDCKGRTKDGRYKNFINSITGNYIMFAPNKYYIFTGKKLIRFEYNNDSSAEIKIILTTSK